MMLRQVLLTMHNQLGILMYKLNSMLNAVLNWHKNRSIDRI
jgi:hypothetical protein